MSKQPHINFSKDYLSPITLIDYWPADLPLLLHPGIPAALWHALVWALVTHCLRGHLNRSRLLWLTPCMHTQVALFPVCFHSYFLLAPLYLCRETSNFIYVCRFCLCHFPSGYPSLLSEVSLSHTSLNITSWRHPFHLIVPRNTQERLTSSRRKSKLLPKFPRLPQYNLSLSPSPTTAPSVFRLRPTLPF